MNLNIVVDNGAPFKQNWDLIPVLFDDDCFDVVDDVPDVLDLLVKLGCFSSKSQARKNWKGGDIQPGFNHWVVGKKKKELCVFVPILVEDVDEY